MTTFAVTVLGNNAALPAQGRHPTSQVLHYHDRNYLLDCGEGTQMQMQLYRIKSGKLNHAFVTHLHGDHYYGLIGLLTSMHLNQRKSTFHVFAPAGLEEIIKLNFKYSETELNYAIEFHVVDTNSSGKIGEDDYLEFFNFPLHHRISCCGYIFREKPRPAKFRKELLKKYGVKGVDAVQAIKRGEDFTTENGLVVSNSEFTYPQPQRSYAFLGDTIYHQGVAEYLKGVDMIYHESTFLNDDSARAAERFHSTASQAATIAKEAGVKKLLLGHFSAKYRDTELFENEAQVVFENSIATKEGDVYLIE